MRIAVGTDEVGALPSAVVETLSGRGDQVTLFGALDGTTVEWAEVGRQVAEAVTRGDADAGVVICWTGTGVTIAANKVPGARCALCIDAATARMARQYNHANVLALSMRVTSAAMGDEILHAFLDTHYGSEALDLRNVGAVDAMDGASRG